MNFRVKDVRLNIRKLITQTIKNIGLG